MLGLSDASLGAVIAATITAIISFLGLIISKEQKVSDFRQAWIDALRSELAAVIAHTETLNGLKSLAGLRNDSERTEFEKVAEIWKVTNDDFVQVNKAIVSIQMRLNPEENDHKAILSNLSELEDAIDRYTSLPESLKKRIEESIVANGRMLLKREWRRVKQGELRYRIVMWTAIVIVIAGFAFLLYSCAFNPSYPTLKCALNS